MLAWSRIVNVWLEDEDPGLARTMAAMDRELTRGEMLVGRAEDLHRLTSPLRALARAILTAPFAGARDRHASTDDDDGLDEPAKRHA